MPVTPLTVALILQGGVTEVLPAIGGGLDDDAPARREGHLFPAHLSPHVELGEIHEQHLGGAKAISARLEGHHVQTVRRVATLAEKQQQLLLCSRDRFYRPVGGELEFALLVLSTLSESPGRHAGHLLQRGEGVALQRDGHRLLLAHQQLDLFDRLLRKGKALDADLLGQAPAARHQRGGHNRDTPQSPRAWNLHAHLSPCHLAHVKRANPGSRPAGQLRKPAEWSAAKPGFPQGARKTPACNEPEGGLS